MGKPAARITDMHTCPMQTPGLPPIPHVGGPIIGPGAPTVLIGGMPAAVVGDTATCVGPPDTVTAGSAGVIISGRPAARMGDPCAHGGTIVFGLPTVLIGETSPGAPPLVIVPPFPGSTTARSTPAAQQAPPPVSAAARPVPKKEPDSEKPLFWAEFHLVGEDGKGIGLEKYRVTLPDGSIREGVTDASGRIRIDGIESQGSCKISFPEIDQDCWEEA